MEILPRAARLTQLISHMSNAHQPPVPTALALSGGGFRATLFHLGVLEYLRDVDLLRGVRKISSVSGGSIVAAHLALNWEHYNGPDAAFLDAKQELIELTRVDVRGRILRRLLIFGWVPRKLRKLFTAGGDTSDAMPTWLLERCYDRWLFKGATMRELPATPSLYILATNLTKGCLTSFGQTHISHFPSNEGGCTDHVDAGLLKISSAVAASSAFPALFPPLDLDHTEVGARADRFPPQFFTDAGVTDNLGLQPFQLNGDQSPEHTVLVSDAGQSFLSSNSATFGIIRTAFRATDVMMFRVRTMALHGVRNSLDQNVAIASISDHVETAGAAPLEIQQPLETIRTDLDAFNEVEIEELIRHGYYCAQKSIGIRGKNPPSFEPEARAATERARKLIEGATRQPRLVNFRDWVTWTQLFCVLAFIWLAFLAAPIVAKTVRVAFTQFRIQRIPPPEWQPLPALAAEEVDKLEQPRNDGFEILRDDRVWDLTHLMRDTAHGTVPGLTRMTRTTTLVRQSPSVTEFAFWFRTSGSHFAVTCLSPANCKVHLRTQSQPGVNGTLLKSYELRIDVSGTPPQERFMLVVQTETENGFLTPPNWSAAMQVTERVDEASIRVIVPKDLTFKDVKTLNYLSNTAAQADTRVGNTVLNAEKTDLVWIIERPTIGWTYGLRWGW